MDLTDVTAAGVVMRRAGALERAAPRGSLVLGRESVAIGTASIPPVRARSASARPPRAEWRLPSVLPYGTRPNVIAMRTTITMATPAARTVLMKRV